ncbi:MAG: Holliday junction branch migration protein RuvA, partial [Sporomusaceae bacterium]|nr:Holliday junction branch migration protein RuvA [Sporomusaceae bacterium]
MIGYLKGQISHLFTDYCFIDVQGVGYRVFIPLSTRQKLSVGLTATLFTSLQVREDAMLLYGFFTQAEYDLFIHLTSVSGIGPKVALSVLSVMKPEEVQAAISQKNVALLTKIPGIGKKTAERLILELKDKLGALETDEELLAVGDELTDRDAYSEALA